MKFRLDRGNLNIKGLDWGEKEALTREEKRRRGDGAGVIKIMCRSDDQIFNLGMINNTTANNWLVIKNILKSRALKKVGEQWKSPGMKTPVVPKSPRLKFEHTLFWKTEPRCKFWKEFKTETPRHELYASFAGNLNITSLDTLKVWKRSLPTHVQSCMEHIALVGINRSKSRELLRFSSAVELLVRRRHSKRQNYESCGGKKIVRENDKKPDPVKQIKKYRRRFIDKQKNVEECLFWIKQRGNLEILERVHAEPERASSRSRRPRPRPQAGRLERWGLNPPPPKNEQGA